MKINYDNRTIKCPNQEAQKKRLVVYVNSMNALGGIERVIANLTGALSKFYDIVILVKDEPISAYRLEEAVKIQSISAELKVNMNSKLQRILSVFINIGKSIRMLKKWTSANEYDYIYTAFPTNSLEVYLADKKHRTKIVASEHASVYAYNFVYRKIKQWLYPRLKVISVPTTMDTKVYKSLGYNAVYIPHLSTYGTNNYIKKNKKIAINVGRLTSDKQQGLLLEIWKLLNERIPNNEWKLKIIGSGEEESYLSKYISDNALKNVELVPHVSNIEQYYKEAELFLFTSRMEGFGMVLLEAMSFGVPCISYDCTSGPRDIIKDGFNGFLVECYDKQKYVNKVIEYMSLPNEQIDLMRKNALSTVEKWDNVKIVKKWLNLFEALDNQSN